MDFVEILGIQESEDMTGGTFQNLTFDGGFNSIGGPAYKGNTVLSHNGCLYPNKKEFNN
ncbi:hypothetical protein V202x_41690 [Gimesia aquarii]|uniref:Uncharacterized protein n=1 Tax=Gimesia aquarii TaxID=2527964 RepID=A0A517WZS4_9PLAN|nr:hypothetical protein V202x_41690 [Gimesia aquarii]